MRAILNDRIIVVTAPIFSFSTRSAKSPSQAAKTIMKSKRFHPSLKYSLRNTYNLIVHSIVYIIAKARLIFFITSVYDLGSSYHVTAMQRVFTTMHPKMQLSKNLLDAIFYRKSMQ